MTDIGPGTPLICVDAGEGSEVATPYPGGNLTVGGLYFVADTFTSAPGDVCERDHCGCTFLVLRGKPDIYGYCPNRFRPLNDGSTDLVDVVKDEQETFEKLIAGAAQWGIIIPNRQLKTPIK
jgi:hypothetical protein